MIKVRSYIIATILGIALAFASMVIVGYSMAIAVPAEILKPLTQISLLLAFIVVDIFTISIPLAVAFLILAFTCKAVFKTNDDIFYLLLLTPLCLLHAYFMLQGPPQLNIIMPMLPRFLLLAICFYFLTRINKSVNATLALTRPA